MAFKSDKVVGYSILLQRTLSEASMSKSNFKSLMIATSATLVVFSAYACQLPAGEGAAADEKKSPVRTVEQVRREVRMLDDIYKGGIVTITQHYVNDSETIPAGTAFKKLFESAEKNGWHRVRLVDATGEPLNDENVAEDDFEKSAIAKLVGGKSWVEEVELRDGIKHLRVATPIPVVFEKCTMCHDNYEDTKPGQAIGALTYVVPIDGKLVTKSSSEKEMSGKEKSSE